MCKLAIVILNWNGADMLRQYLPSVIGCSSAEGVSVVVADNGSTDNSLSVMASEFPDVRTISLDRNYGFADGYNRALRQVDATYYMLLNSDVEIRQPRWLEPMLQYMDAHEDVAACQPKLLKLGDESRFEYAGAAGGYIDRWGYPYCRGRVLQTVETDHGQYDDIADVHWTTGAAMMVRSDVYWKAGGLDPRFFAHMEEIDLCWRMRIIGYRLVCIPQSTAYHLGGATLHQGNPRKTFLNFRNNRLMLYKNLPDDALHRVMTVRLMLDMMAMLQFTFKGDLANAKAVWKAWREYCSMKTSYKPIRRQIQARRVLSPYADTSHISILWQYYVKGRGK